MRQLSGIKVFLFGYLCYVVLAVILDLFLGFNQWNREFIFMFFVFGTFSIFLSKGYFDKFLSKKIKQSIDWR